MCKISVIVPVHNGYKYISRSLNTIFEQEFRDFEIIVVDNGSRDRTAEIVRKTFQENARRQISARLISQKHSGTSVARNSGTANASGKYLYFFDADDLMCSSLLSKMHENAEEADADMVFCGFDRVSPTGDVLTSYDDSYDFLDEIVDGMTPTLHMLKGLIRLWNGSVMYKASHICRNSLEFTPGCTFVQDGEFILKALVSARTVRCVKESLVLYVQRSGSLSRQKGLKMFHAVGAMRRAKAFMQSKQVTSEIIKLMDTRFIPTAYVAALDAVALSGASERQMRTLLSNSVIRRALRDLSYRAGVPFRRAFFLKYFPRLFFKYRIVRANRLQAST